jgi:hypothetical protein
LQAHESVKIPLVLAAGAIAVAAQPAFSVPVQQSEPPTQVVPLSWSQLLSADYRTYIKNLRDIGCPQPTLRAIVTADVEVRYRERREALAQKLDALSNGSWEEELNTYQEQQVMKAELLKLPDEEHAEICDLLGIRPATTLAATPAHPGNPLMHPRPPREKPVAMPLVLQNIDLADLNLSDKQQQAVADVRQDFLAKVGVAKQIPEDPTAQSLWQEAQTEADAKLEIVLGNLTFNKYRTLGYQASLAVNAKQSQ